MIHDDLIAWGPIRLLPNSQAALPVDPPQQRSNNPAAEHYYHAREVDAAVVETAGQNSERERFLFYRGLGEFVAPLTAAADEDGVRLLNAGDALLGPGFVLEVAAEAARFVAMAPLPAGEDMESPSLKRPGKPCPK